jgi:hypothetical protein
VRIADNPPPSSADVMESGSLNLPEPSGPHSPVMGLLYPFFYCMIYLACPSIQNAEQCAELLKLLNTVQIREVGIGTCTIVVIYRFVRVHE